MRRIDHVAKGAGNVGAAVGRQAPKAKHVAKQRDQAISQHISHYAENPRAHSKELRKLGYSAAQLRVVHRNQTRPVYTGPRAAPISDKESAVLSSPAHQAARQKRYAAIDRAYKAPGSDYALGSLGSLGNIVNVATGVDPIHPLRNKIGGSAAANIGLGVASLIPGGKGLRAGAKALRAVKGAEKGVEATRAAEKVAVKVPKPPKAPRPTKTVRKMAFPSEMPAEVQQSAHRLAHALDKPRIKALRVQQDKLHSLEKGKRASVAAAALEKHAGTPEAIRIATSKLAGKLPTVNMTGALGDIGAKDLNLLRGYIHTNKGLSLFDKIDVERALEKTIAGRPPTERDRLMLHRVFGKEFVNKIEQPTLGNKLARGAAEIANLPRSLESSYDVSGLGRQALVAAARHPVLVGKNISPMMKALKSEKSYSGTMAEITGRPNYQTMRETPLAITDMRSGMSGDREEFFPSNWAEKIPGVGMGVKGSSRAYHALLAKTRADMFDLHFARAAKAGYDVKDAHFQKSLADFVNAATGRGNIGKLAPAARALSAVFFSPRLLASRINFLNPVWYAKLHPYARKEAARSMVHLAAFATGLLELAHQAGADVELDPRSSDWGKIRVGDNRVDILGGFQSVIRLAAQEITNEKKDSHGDIVKLGHGFGQQSRLDVAARFARGKAAPVPSLVFDAAEGTDFVGQPVTLKSEAWQRLTPFGLQDSVDVYNHTGHSIPAAVGAFGVSAVGGGVQSYDSTGRSKIEDKYKAFHDKVEKATLAAAVHTGKTPADAQRALKWTRGRLALRRERTLARDKAGAHGAGKGKERYLADLSVLVAHKWVKPARAKELEKWVQTAKPDDITASIKYLTDHYFDVGNELTATIKYLREHGDPTLTLKSLP